MAADTELQSLIDQRQNALNFIAANANNPALAPNVANAKSYAEASDYSIQQKEIALAQQAAASSSVPPPTNTTIQNLQDQLNQAKSASNASFVNDKVRSAAEQAAEDKVNTLYMQLVAEQAKAATTGVTPLVTVPKSTVSPYVAKVDAPSTIVGGTGTDKINTTGILNTEELTKAYTDALASNQTALSKQNEDFLKNWQTSADTLKTDILTGVDTKNQAFGTQATKGFMDAFKNFQIPTTQQTGVNMGNYNDNRNAAADQWWSQYVTGRR
jgi:hypothetical protein